MMIVSIDIVTRNSHHFTDTPGVRAREGDEITKEQCQYTRTTITP